MVDKELEDSPKSLEPKTYWTETGVFVLYGKGYMVTEECGVCCIGEYPPPDISQNTPETPPEALEVVSKLPDQPPALSFDDLASCCKTPHPGGRPRKSDDETTSRATAWRRRKEKEEQGVLL